LNDKGAPIPAIPDQDTQNGRVRRCCARAAKDCFKIRL
jgi:hypothetical protein